MVTVSNTVELYTDGSAIRNPGASGAAFVLQWDEIQDNELPIKKQMMGSKGFRLSTNSRMEILAAIEGLNAFIEKYTSGLFSSVGQINLYSDSEYLCNAINKHWIEKWQSNNWMKAAYNNNPASPVANKDLWERLIISMNAIKNNGVNLVFNHVLGHSGIPLNEKADELAQNAANDIANHLVDTEYENSKRK